MEIMQVPSTPFLGVTRDGRVMNLKTKRWLKLHDNGHGYVQVHTTANNKQVMRYVHRLVAECYIPNPLNMSEINHKDGNKQNNAADNLEWCTRKYNIKHSIQTGLRKPSEKQKQAARNTLNKINANRVCMDDDERRERKKEQQKRYRQTHKEEVLLRDRERHGRYYSEHQEELKLKARERYTKRRNDLSIV